ncbi:PQQ-binding-like beta-propeller repeat protein [Streptosporangium sp. NPDC000509]|uniref:PQQ-binding-like beta-propeller repeat protein n=1 Tax=Streptosporangium sp. NPDC000509 TaxID=3366186 RepID=UPI0036D04311
MDQARSCRGVRSVEITSICDICSTWCDARIFDWDVAAARGLVYVSDDSRLYALDAATGAARWSFPVGKGFTSGPVRSGSPKPAA